MKIFRSSPALYIKRVKNEVISFSGIYVDDMIRTGTAEFRKYSLVTHTRFELGNDKEFHCNFTGFMITRNAGDDIVLHQRDYLEKLKILPEDASDKDFFSVKMRPVWLCHSRQNCLFQISELTQLTKPYFEENNREVIKRTNILIKFAINNKAELRYMELDLCSLKVISFSDASFAGSKDLTSQLAYIFFIGDKTGNVARIIFKSYKARRVTRSVTSAELIAFSDSFDATSTLRSELKSLHPS